MSGVLVEACLCLLLVFAPFAFGGVELWAQGVIQIVAGVAVAAWAWRAMESRRTEPAPRDVAGGGRAATVMWCGIACFVLLVALQLIPIPPAWVRALSPAAHSLYARTLPGYAEGRGFDVSELPGWMSAAAADRIPGAGGAPVDAALRDLPMEALGLPTRFPAWRTLSVCPFETRQRLSLLLCCIGVFAAARGRFTDRDRIGRMMAIAVAVGFAASMFGIVQKLTWNGKIYWLRETTNPHVFGPFANRNSYAAFAVTLLPISVGMSLWCLRRVQQGRRDALPQLVLWTLPAVAMSAGIFYSLSRGGMIAAVLSVLLLGVLVLLLVGRAVDLALMALLAAAAAGFLVWLGPEKVVERVETMSEGTDLTSVSSRLDAWRRALDLVADYPLLGSGFGTFRYAYMPYAPPGATWWSLADNEYIELLCDTGMVGGLLFTVVLGAFLVVVTRPSRLQDSFSRYALAGLVSGLAALAMHSAANAALQVPSNALLLAILGAALLGLIASGRSPSRGRVPTSGARPLPWERAGRAAGGTTPEAS